MSELVVHISDHNMKDRVFTVDRAAGLALIRDETKTPEKRMSQLWELAAEEGKTENDPRVSEMDGADLFLPWPYSGKGANDEWREALAEGLGGMDDE